MSKTTTMHFTYDPLHIVRLILDIYAESLERKGKNTKAIQFARYKFLKTMTDEELKGILQEYVKGENLEEVYIQDSKEDGERIFKYIYQTDRYKELELYFNKSGFGATGYGVVDKSDNTFYDCYVAHHWEKIMEIVKEKYSRYHKALEKFWLYETLNEYEGITRKELDDFIMQRFELVGGNKPLDQYIS